MLVLLVQEDGLEHMVLERLGLRAISFTLASNQITHLVQLILEGSAVKAHFLSTVSSPPESSEYTTHELASIGRDLLDEVHTSRISLILVYKPTLELNLRLELFLALLNSSTVIAVAQL
jgi:hypothetical protein